MKTVKKLIFPILLILTCGVVHFWQNAAASLTYLPMNEVLPLGILTPALPVLTFFTTFALLKQSKTSKPVRRSLLSTAAMLAIILAVGIYFLSYLSYRFAAVLPVLVLPDWPAGKMTMFITFLCLTHLTGLLICGFIKLKTPKNRVIAASVGWFLLNACLFLVTT